MTNADDQIKRTRIDAETEVSTIRLPIHRHYRYVVAETVVLGGPLNNKAERYDSIREAEVGHDAWVARARSGDLSGTRYA